MSRTYAGNMNELLPPHRLDPDRETAMPRREWDGVTVSAVCPDCAALVTAPYCRIAADRHFHCDCGREFEADMVKTSTAAVLEFLAAA
jgi:hypothetical protein